MIRGYIKLTIFVLILSSCRTKSIHGTIDTYVNEIVLVNAGTIDRCKMGELINAISKCNPKVANIVLDIISDLK